MYVHPTPHSQPFSPHLLSLSLDVILTMFHRPLLHARQNVLVPPARGHALLVLGHYARRDGRVCGDGSAGWNFRGGGEEGDAGVGEVG